MKKEICWDSQDCPAHMSKFIYKNKIKRKDIISINRLKDGSLEIWFFAKHFEDISKGGLK